MFNDLQTRSKRMDFSKPVEPVDWKEYAQCALYSLLALPFIYFLLVMFVGLD